MKKAIAIALLLTSGAVQAAGTYVVLCKTLTTAPPSCEVSITPQPVLVTDFVNSATALGCVDLGNYAYDCRSASGDFANTIVRGTPPLFPFDKEMKAIVILQ
jgi:hypothetical protein